MSRTALILLGAAALVVAPSQAPAKDDTTVVVGSALGWLARHQTPDGSWSPHQWAMTCTKGACRGGTYERGDSRYVVGVTALAVQAFVAAKHTHMDGAHKAAVAKALAFLLKQQQPDGSFAFRRGEEVYNHAMATLALCELLVATKDKTLEQPAQKAVGWIGRAQNPGLGWQYGVKTGKSDTSVTGWMVQAMHAATRAGLLVPTSAFQGAKRWFDRATARSSGKAGYNRPGGGSAMLRQTEGKYDQVPAMTAMSVHCRALCGEKRSEDTMRKGAKLIEASLPVWEPKRLNAYYWLAGTRAMAVVGGKPRKAWNEALSLALVGKQRPDGCAKGSWDPNGEWCVAGGRVYFTAVNALALLAMTQAPPGPPADQAVPHGGELGITIRHVFEVVLTSDGVRVYINDDLSKPVPVDGIEGVVQVSVYPVVNDVYRPRYKAKKGKRLLPRLQAKEDSRRRKFNLRLREKRKPKRLKEALKRVGPDPAAGRRRGHLAAKLRVGGRFMRVEVTLDLKNVPGNKTRPTRVVITFTDRSKPVFYTCKACKQRHEDPGPCLKCGEPVK